MLFQCTDSFFFFSLKNGVGAIYGIGVYLSECCFNFGVFTLRNRLRFCLMIVYGMINTNGATIELQVALSEEIFLGQPQLGAVVDPRYICECVICIYI